MRVFYKAEVSVYRQGAVRWCCTGMARWWGVLVGFGVRDCASTSRTVNIYLNRPQANGKTAVEVVPIDCCPWCGEAVEVCRSKATS
jgi:hypothetical protein